MGCSKLVRLVFQRFSRRKFHGSAERSSNWRENVRKELEIESPKESDSVCIYRVPSSMRQVEPRAYRPNNISIGLCHYGAPHLREMELLKKKFYRRLFDPKGVNGAKLDSVMEALERLEGTARKCYAEEIRLSKDEFLEMMLIDASFIIQLLRDLSKNDFRQVPDDLSRWMVPTIRRELIMLENQIPLFVLSKVFDSTYDCCAPADQSQSLEDLALRFFYPLLQADSDSNPDPSKGHHHFLDLLRSSISPTFKGGNPRGTQEHMMRSATELKLVGVKIKAGADDVKLPLLDISFRKKSIGMGRELNIPPLYINDHRGTVFRNMVAFEKCHKHCKPDVTTYLFFFNGLVNSAKDVDLLHYKEVLHHSLGDNEEVAKLINNISKEVIRDKDESYLYQEVNDANDYFFSPYAIIRGKLAHHYFSSWVVGISTIGAFLALYFSFIQTLSGYVSALDALEKKQALEYSGDIISKLRSSFKVLFLFLWPGVESDIALEFNHEFILMLYIFEAAFGFLLSLEPIPSTQELQRQILLSALSMEASALKQVFCYFHMGGTIVRGTNGQRYYEGGRTDGTVIKEGTSLGELLSTIGAVLQEDVGERKLMYTLNFDLSAFIDLTDDAGVIQLLQFNDTCAHLYVVDGQQPTPMPTQPNHSETVPNSTTSPQAQIPRVASARFRRPSLHLLEETGEVRVGYFALCVPLYKHALQGNWPEAKRILDKKPEIRNAAIAHGWPTVLHVAAGANRLHFVEELLSLLKDNELDLQDHNGDTAFCFAAAAGNKRIAEIMLERSPYLPKIRGTAGLTPLHFAALQGRSEMAWCLYSITIDDGFEERDWNKLFFACINTGIYDLALQMLKERQVLALALDDESMETGLHVLARKPLDCRWQSKAHLNKVMHSGVKQTPALQLVSHLWEAILKIEKEEAKIRDIISEPSLLLFDATKVGNFEFLAELLRSYPDLIWELDSRGRSIIHIAVLHRHPGIFNLIHEIGSIKDIIVTYVDNKNGNNLLHLAAKLAPSTQLNLVTGAAFQMCLELLWFEEVKKIMLPSDIEKKNTKGKTPRELFTKKHENLLTKAESWMKGTAKSCMLVSTLIATGVFTAAFSIPGGNDDGNKGSPNYLKKPAFLIFAISDTIALISSSTSILIFLSILISRYAEDNFSRSLPLKLIFGLGTLFISIMSMMISFSSAFFITYYYGLKWVPIFTAALASLPIFLFIFLQFPLWSDIMYSTYYCRYLFRPSKLMLS